MTPETSYSDTEFCFMDDMLMGNAQLTESNMEMDCTQSDLAFRDPFTKKSSLQLNMPLPPDFQALKNFVGGESVNPFEYALSESSDSYFPSVVTPESPKGSTSYYNSLRSASIAMPSLHCCYSSAYATLEGLQFQNADKAAPQPAELMSLDSVLCITKTAVQSVTKLLACPCAADPHLAMLYSSITSKIITWYQIAAGMKPSSFSPPMTPALSTKSTPSSAASSAFSSPLTTPSSTSGAFNIKIQPLKIGEFEFDEADQEALRRQVVLRELKKCGSLVEAIANWRSGASAEQAEFLYDILGAWLKSELYKTVRDITGGEESGCG